MSEVQTTAVKALNRKPVTAADFKNNAEVLHALALTATANYNDTVAAYNRALELENIVPGITVTFNEGKGEKAETLSGRVITKLDTGAYQVLVQFVGQPAKLSNVKPADVVAIHKPEAEQEVEQVAAE